MTPADGNPMPMTNTEIGLGVLMILGVLGLVIFLIFFITPPFIYYADAWSKYWHMQEITR